MIDDELDLGNIVQEDTTKKGIGDPEILGLEKEVFSTNNIYTTSASDIAASRGKLLGDYELIGVHHLARAGGLNNQSGYLTALQDLAKKAPEQTKIIADLRVTYIPQEKPAYLLSATAMREKTDL